MSKTIYDTIMNDIIKEVVNPLLKEKQFKKTGQNFYKQVNDFWICINWQSIIQQYSKDFTFNLGVCHPKAYELYYEQPFPKTPKPMYSIDYKRLGQLAKGRDYWYSVNENINIYELKEEINEHLSQYAIPYLEKFRETKDIIEFLKDDYKPDFQYVALLFISGYKKDALNLLKNDYVSFTQQDNIVWKEKTREFAERLSFRLEE